MSQTPPKRLLKSVHQRARGALLGMAVGDAFGTTLEFTRPTVPPHPTLLAGPHVDMVGQGPFGLAPGQVTDDTQMACCLAASLAEHGAYDVADVARRYLYYYDHCFDIGSTISGALTLVSEVGPEQSGQVLWEQRDRRPAANGALMRATPIAIAFDCDPAKRRHAALTDARITHFDFRCQLANSAFTAAIATGLHATGDVVERSEQMHAAAALELEECARDLVAAFQDEATLIQDAGAQLRQDLEVATQSDSRLYGQDGFDMVKAAGYVRLAFRLAFWSLMHAPTYRAAMVDIANRGGDADTNCAIAGGLLGALFHESGIPERWRSLTLGALQDGPPSPLRDALHPKMLFRLPMAR